MLCPGCSTTVPPADTVTVFLKDTRQYKKMPAQYGVSVEDGAKEAAEEFLGKGNVQVVFEQMNRVRY